MSVIQSINSGNIVNMDFIQVVSGNLRRIREKKRITQDQLAAKMNTTKSYISGVENGHRNIRLQTIKAFCVALDIAPATLFRYRPEDLQPEQKAAS